MPRVPVSPKVQNGAEMEQSPVIRAVGWVRTFLGRAESACMFELGGLEEELRLRWSSPNRSPTARTRSMHCGQKLAVELPKETALPTSSLKEVGTVYEQYLPQTVTTLECLWASRGDKTVDLIGGSWLSDSGSRSRHLQSAAER
jgi:hypothetical protein